MRRRPIAAAAALAFAWSLLATTGAADNPIVTDIYTADPAALVHDGQMYIYTGRDEAEVGQNQFVMREWHAFSSDAPATEPEAWTHHGALLSLDDFAWARYVDGSADNVSPLVTWDETGPSAFVDLGTETVLGTTALTEAPARANVTTCSTILRGEHDGSLIVTTAVTCLDGATIAGDVAVEPGGALVAVDSTVTGSVTANKAWLLRMARTEVGESVTVTNGTGRVDVAAATIGDALNLIGNRTDAPALVSGDDIGGVLNCQRNEPAPVNEGRPNRVGGPALGQCATLEDG
jgi:hypothetical protein